LCWYDWIKSLYEVICGNYSDVDECVKSNGGCQHVCKNEVGSYQCLCHSGHLLGTDEYNCEGINKVTELA